MNRSETRQQVKAELNLTQPFLQGQLPIFLRKFSTTTLLDTPDHFD
jgi:hypothetical protein